MPTTDQAARFRSDLASLTGAPLASSERLGIAVSGGPDSLALLLLAHAAYPGQVAAATVDHGLRPEAAAEARFVGEVCARFDIPHEILIVDTPLAGNIQSQARLARYALLERWCTRHTIGWLATAHHLDDQAETIVMRLLRGAGLAGLAGVRPKRALGDPSASVHLIRPLLGWRRAELAEIVASAGLCAVDDPGNRDERQDRARIRIRLAQTAWLDPLPLARSAAILGEAEDALGWSAERLWEKRASICEGRLDIDVAGLPRELRRRLLARGLQTLLDAKGGPHAPRGDAVDRLLTLLDAGRPGTLAGLSVRPGPIWHIAVAPPRRKT